MKKTACIITGGTVCPEFLKEKLKALDAAQIIVVDGALEVTDSLGIKPDFIVGDFDTVNPELLLRYPEKIIRRHLPEKDQTDTELALETATESGCDHIILFGATGSRLDHSLANIFLLQKMAAKGVDAELCDEHNRLSLRTGNFVIKKEEQYGDFVSLLPLTERVENVTLNGLKYSLENHTFFREDSLGISNEIIAEEATVTFSAGMFLVVESKDK